ncbi:mevalonate kinase isoform X2 [Apis laboriosa]|uniref:mevalonate kinase isoform X2 n=1 Tax=Apis laboriosa TaxID=183418 RepID=UPI001CC5ECAA|nr:mevalonate kinase isoform X2 [Apis laboriosa]
MIQFKVSAPGKVILFGEHAVVYGKTAVAASIDLRTVLNFTELPEAEQVVKICFSKVNLFITIPLQQIQNFFFINKNVEFIENYEIFYNKIKEFVCIVSYANFQQKLSLEAFFYTLIYIAQKEEMEIKPFQIQLNTELAINSGLGSSASFAVCLAACFVHWSYLQKNIYKVFDFSTLDIISKYALNCERIMHGNPSGIDNCICTYGSIIEFKKDNISKEAVKIIQKLKTFSNTNEFFLEGYKQLMILINMNQGLLATCQISHPSLDRICAEAQNYGLAAKLTGAGGGGHAYILLLPDTQPETISSISRKLIADGFTVKLTTLGCSGVQIN